MSSQITVEYADIIKQLIQNSSQSAITTEDNVFQAGSRDNRKLIEKILERQLLPKSGIIGMENIEELYTLCTQGKSCLILMEHYSNFDLPAIVYLLEKSGEKGRKIAAALIAIAGMKLNAENPVVRAFSEAYSRIVIYPSRSFDSITDPEVLKEERKKSNTINRAALHEMVRRKRQGHIILVFPAGTRYRPGVPDTKRGLKEIDSYMKSFDHMVFIGSGGNALRVSPNEEMAEDILVKDTIVFKIGPVLSCEEFRAHTRSLANPESDIKQFSVNKVMEELDKLHNEVEAVREEKTP